MDGFSITESTADFYWQIIHDHPVEFKLGLVESQLSTGVTYDGDPESAKSIAYDFGRTFGEAMHALWENLDMDHPLWNDDAYCDHGPSIYESYCPKCTGYEDA